MAKDHDYCCCAIPLLNVGIYLTIIEQFSISLLAGILAIATPPLVGASTPSIAPWLFAAGCFVVCAIQTLGFIGVFKENATLFQRFVSINAFAISYVFGIAATWIIISATRHTPAKDKCITTFYADGNSSTNSTSVFSAGGQADTVCNIFTWVDVGLMGGLWLVMLIFQGYLILVCRWYSSSQLADHSKYYSIYSVTAPEGINLGERQDAWDPRPSTDSWSPTRGGVTSPTNAQPYRDHSRSPSETLEQPYGVGAAEYREKESAYGYQPNYPRRQESEGMSEAYVTHPDQAYTSQPQPTPMTLVSPEKRYANEADSSMVLPPGAMYPTEGQFGRKTPRDEYNLPYDQAYGGVTYGQSTSAPSYHTQQPHQPYNPQR